MQRFVSDVEFSCPICGELNTQEIEVPEPNFEVERFEDLRSEGEIELFCGGCDNDFKGDVWIHASYCDITLVDYEDTKVICGPPHYEELFDEWEIPEHPRNVFNLNAHELRDIINKYASESGGSTINRMIFVQILTILEAYFCDNLIKGIRDNLALLVSFSKQDSEISKIMNLESDVIADSNYVKNIEQNLKNRIYHRFGSNKKNQNGVPHWYKAAFGFSLTPDPDDIERLKNYANLRHDCVHRNGETKDKKKHDQFNKDFLLEALTIAERIVQHIDSNMNNLSKKND